MLATNHKKLLFTSTHINNSDLSVCISIEAQKLRPDKFLFRVFMNHSPPELQFKRSRFLIFGLIIRIFLSTSKRVCKETPAVLELF